MHYAVYTGRDGIITVLLRAGADKELVDAEGKTPLALAQSLKMNPIADLITNGPPPEAEEAAETPAAE